jgi:hypothetical protein
VRINACNPDGELRLGMPATVVLDLDAQPDEAAQTGRQRCGK